MVQAGNFSNDLTNIIRKAISEGVLELFDTKSNNIEYKINYNVFDVIFTDSLDKEIGGIEYLIEQLQGDDIPNIEVANLNDFKVLQVVNDISKIELSGMSSMLKLSKMLVDENKIDIALHVKNATTLLMNKLVALILKGANVNSQTGSSIALPNNLLALGTKTAGVNVSDPATTNKMVIDMVRSQKQAIKTAGGNFDTLLISESAFDLMGSIPELNDSDKYLNNKKMIENYVICPTPKLDNCGDLGAISIAMPNNPSITSVLGRSPYSQEKAEWDDLFIKIKTAIGGSVNTAGIDGLVQVKTNLLG